MTSEADVGGMEIDAEPSHRYSITFCCVIDGSRGAVWQNGVWDGSVDEAKVRHWNPSCGKKWHTLTCISICWTFMEIKQWMWAQWGSGWCVSAVVTVMWKKSHVTDSHADYYKHGMQALVHHWWKCTANGGDYVEKQCFVAENLLCQCYCALYICCSSHGNK